VGALILILNITNEHAKTIKKWFDCQSKNRETEVKFMEDTDETENLDSRDSSVHIDFTINGRMSI
jgi:hypothetical protein